MAHVTATTYADIERLLGNSAEAWESLPSVEAESARWELLERIDFVEEWALEEERLSWLERYVADGLLTEEQVVRHSKPKRLVARNRPIIERLRAS